jgi:hypothetical protein
MGEKYGQRPALSLKMVARGLPYHRPQPKGQFDLCTMLERRNLEEMAMTTPTDKMLEALKPINELIDKLMEWNAFHDMPGETCRLSPEEVGTAIVALEKHVAALEAAEAYAGLSSQPVIADGWQMVPVEPTLEMFEAGEGAFFTTYTGTATSSPDRVWKAMLAAAPVSPQPTKG